MAKARVDITLHHDALGISSPADVIGGQMAKHGVDAGFVKKEYLVTGHFSATLLLRLTGLA